VTNFVVIFNVEWGRSVGGGEERPMHSSRFVCVAYLRCSRKKRETPSHLSSQHQFLLFTLMESVRVVALLCIAFLRGEKGSLQRTRWSIPHIHHT